jgi:hypothetical protein
MQMQIATKVITSGKRTHVSLEPAGRRADWLTRSSGAWAHPRRRRSAALSVLPLAHPPLRPLAPARSNKSRCAFSLHAALLCLPTNSCYCCSHSP